MVKLSILFRPMYITLNAPFQSIQSVQYSEYRALASIAMIAVQLA